jgi:hypothetical protein
MGALEAADGMLLFGISTAFMFTVLQRITIIVDRIGDRRASRSRTVATRIARRRRSE